MVAERQIEPMYCIIHFFINLVSLEKIVAELADENEGLTRMFGVMVK